MELQPKGVTEAPGTRGYVGCLGAGAWTQFGRMQPDLDIPKGGIFGILTMTLQFANGSLGDTQAGSLSCCLTDDTEYRESMAC